MPLFQFFLEDLDDRADGPGPGSLQEIPVIQASMMRPAIQLVASVSDTFDCSAF